MARTFDGTSSYLATYGTAAVLTAPPITFSAWVYPTTISINQSIVAVTDNSNSFTSISLGILSSNKVALRTYSGSTLASAVTSTTVGANAWAHACGTTTSSSARAAFLNGGGKVTDSTANAVSGLNTTSVGYRAQFSNTEMFVGRVAEVSIWNVALADAEVLALASGVHSTRIRPSALVAYWPVWGISSPEPDLTVNKRHLTLVGPPAAADHAPIRLFTTFGNPIPLIGTATGGPFPMFDPKFRDMNFVG